MRLLPITLCALLATPAVAQEATTRLQDATVVAKGSTISITRLPIRTATGVVYRDVTIELHVDAQGHVTLATAGGSAPAQVAVGSVPSGQVDLPQRASPPIVMQIFRGGTYAAPDGSLVHVEDRGDDLIHHVPVWSLSSDGAGLMSSATWYSGPPAMNPRSRRLRNAGITGMEYAYGTSDGGASELFGSGALIGVAQIGQTLRFVSFKKGCCTDAEAPVASMTFTYVGR